MRRLLAFVVLAAAAAIIGISLGVALRDGGTAATSPRPQDPVRVETRISPDGHLFGSPVVATIDVHLDSRVVDPARIRVEPNFEPYEISGARTVERIDHGGLARVTYTYPLRCLDVGCEPLSARGVVELEDSRLSYRYTDDSSGRPIFETIAWAPFIVTGRVADRAVLDIGWRADETELAAVSYRLEPGSGSIVLLVLAALLAAGAAALAWLLWGRRIATQAGAEEDTQTPLAVVLAAARAAAANGDLPKRRRALESVARELGRIGLVELAGDARTLAWSPREATGAEVEELARRTELATEGTA